MFVVAIGTTGTLGASLVAGVGVSVCAGTLWKIVAGGVVGVAILVDSLSMGEGISAVGALVDSTLGAAEILAVDTTILGIAGAMGSFFRGKSVVDTVRSRAVGEVALGFALVDGCGEVWGEV